MRKSRYVAPELADPVYTRFVQERPSRAALGATIP